MECYIIMTGRDPVPCCFLSLSLIFSFILRPQCPPLISSRLLLLPLRGISIQEAAVHSFYYLPSFFFYSVTSPHLHLHLYLPSLPLLSLHTRTLPNPFPSSVSFHQQPCLCLCLVFIPSHIPHPPFLTVCRAILKG